MQNQKQIIQKTTEFVKNKMQKESTGHDWFHVQRVVNMSKRIAKKEKSADIFIIELAALLHDIADWKFNNGDETIGAKTAAEWLQKLKVDDKQSTT